MIKEETLAQMFSCELFGETIWKSFLEEHLQINASKIKKPGFYCLVI